jgi:hypothetical protein
MKIATADEAMIMPPHPVNSLYFLYSDRCLFEGDAEGGLAFVESGSSLRSESNLLLVLTYNRNNAINQT